MKKIFLVAADIEGAGGSQCWHAEASTFDEALAIVKSGGGTFYEEEVDVTSLSEYYDAGELSEDDIEKQKSEYSNSFSFKKSLPDESGTYLAMWPGKTARQLTDIFFYDGEQYIGKVNEELVSVNKIEKADLPRFLASKDGKFVWVYSEHERGWIPDWVGRVTFEVMHTDFGEPMQGKALDYICKHCGAHVSADEVQFMATRMPCPQCNNKGKPEEIGSAVRFIEDCKCKECGLKLEVGNLDMSTIRIRCPSCKGKV